MGRDTGEELGKTARTRVAESVDVAASEVSSVEVAGLVPELAFLVAVPYSYPQCKSEE